MTEKNREILKAHVFGYSNEVIAEIEDVTIEEVEEIIKNNLEVIQDAKERYNG